jgi:hypothetical protein
MSIHIGQLIEQHFDASGLTLSAFAEKAYLQRQNVRKSVFAKNSIDTETLLRISKVLRHNFFQYYQTNLPGVSENYSAIEEANTDYSKRTKPKFTVSIEIDDPEMREKLIDIIKSA